MLILDQLIFLIFHSPPSQSPPSELITSTNSRMHAQPVPSNSIVLLVSSKSHPFASLSGKIECLFLVEPTVIYICF